ncbi:BCCT family transporter [Rhodococcus erythropolis]|jgi:choline/glycine/proline betaine transport protein|uniref:BCCT family transporter n=1 Tax=Rhodococcus baikonurensis TaxID=172041 RepID=A0ABV5X9H4_9NOCA|nr:MULTISPECIES: BCCT family transporter [Rhodococcus]MBJ7478302.1 BCCT family transporter [Rhodococcus sp. (in: high G+C Gram-positive bacteria)]MCQ4128168.1 BCCT family transporter [Rhodococcus erythropolis]MDI9956736.1 BCCT family transporter [Rhodococcus sp. IEGM 1237]MDI9962724.1 BCCT family transporter [Rhodococcus sp. IEGM 1251]MDV8128908.1 BCCT family transporter [Rhodococcus sp. IEGM 1304]
MTAVKTAWRELRKPVFIPASIVIFALIAFAVIYAGTAADAFETLNNVISDGVGWWYILSATGFVIFALYCGISRIGNIRLGRDDEQPEFGMLSWFAMLFSAGMGIGLVFYGVAEPLSHYVTPPVAGQIAGSTDAAANQAMELTLFHWGLHAWAIYVVVGLGLAYMTYRKGRPLSIRWLLEPLLGRARIEGKIGHAIDVVAIVGTLFGVATSLGFGVQQISAGLDYLGWVETDNWLVITIIVIVTGMATFSVVSGVTKGLKWLSNINMMLAAALALFVLILGPTLFLMQSWVQNLGGYVQALPELMLRTSPFAEDGWQGAWTIFYWGWWMSWAPFVGMFIARISRGRTIREFVFGVLLAPTLVGSLWFTIFGNSGILRQRNEGTMLDASGAVDTNTSLFTLLDGLPLGTISSVLAIVVIVFFFVTSADSGSIVIDILATGGSLETSKITRVYWTFLSGAAAAVLLIVGGSGSLTALQTVAIATAVPFSVIMVLACLSMLKAFRYEVASAPRYLRVSTNTPASTDVPQPTEKRLRDLKISSTFAGLTPSQNGITTEPSDAHMLVAVHEVPAHAVNIDPDTGAVDFSEDSKVVDPLGGEVFDTPEFADSAEGHAQAASTD